MKTCPTCKAAYAEIVRFCAADGTPLVAGAPGEPPTQVAELEQDSSSVLILTLAAVVAAALLGWYLTSTRSPAPPPAPAVEPQR